LLGSGREVLPPLSINSVKYWRSSFKGAKVSGKLKYKAYLPCFIILKLYE